MNDPEKIDTRSLVGKKFEFAYPDEEGKTKILSFTLLAKADEAETFDKFWNFLCSMVKHSKKMKIFRFD
jgi:hypothetical protein